MNWSPLREEGLLVSLEGEGGELVTYSKLRECAICFENGEPCHTLFYLFPSLIYACKLSLPPFSPAGSPELSQLEAAVSAAGSNDVCADTGRMGGAQGK